MAISEAEIMGSGEDESGRREVSAPTIVTDGALIGGLTRAEFDVQIQTALAHPRQMSIVKRRIESLATLDPETAASCVYRKPQKVRNPVTGKMEDGFLEGESARFAEIVLASWGNARVASRQTDVTATDVEATGIFHDLETNVARAVSVRRSIMTSGGKRFSDSLIAVTANAAASIALRNAVLRGIPKAVWGNAYRKAYQAAKGDVSTLTERRRAMLDAFKEIGIKPDVVYEMLGVRGQDDIDLDLMFTASGYLSAIRDGDATLDEILDIRRQPKETRDAASAAFGSSAPRQSVPATGGKPVSAQEATPESTDQRWVFEGVAYPNETRMKEAQRAAKAAAKKATPTDSRAVQNAGASNPTSDSFTDASTNTAPAAEASSQTTSAEPSTAGGADDDGFPGDRRQGPDSVSGSTSEKEAEGPSSLTNEVQSPREPSDADKAVIDSFLARVARADSWLSIKPAIGALRASDAFDLLTVDGRDQLFAHAYRRAKDINDPVRPAEDPEFYCAYLATNPPIEDADREFTRLVLSPAWAKLSDAHKEVIEDLNDLKGVNK